MKKLFIVSVAMTTLFLGVNKVNAQDVVEVSDNDIKIHQEISNNTKLKHIENNLIFPVNEYVAKTMNVGGKEVKYRAYENIVYVKHPVDKQYQSMNIYIPEEYFHNQNIGKLTAKTAPIFLPNGIGGYMPSKPLTPSYSGNIEGEASRIGLTNMTIDNNEPNSLLYALSKGYIVASPGARGRTNSNGKAPAGIIDLKSAVKYLHFNDKIMPGDANKIISNGTSAGGAMSALLGATGDNEDYKPYFDEIGAAEASDKIYAVSAYCPITNLEHADMAYEWQFKDIPDYKKMNISFVDNKIQREISQEKMNFKQRQYAQMLNKQFITYLNSLNLKDDDNNILFLNSNGTGSWSDYVKKYIIQSAQDAINSGSDLSDIVALKIENNTVIDVDIPRYWEYLERSKTAPAFDGINLETPENQLFGTKNVDSLHFTNFSVEYSDYKNIADRQIIKMMNPLNYLQEKNNVAKYWRIRHGAKDSDTGFSIPLILATTLKNEGFNVDFYLPWEQGHSGDYDLEELFDWIDSIC